MSASYVKIIVLDFDKQVHVKDYDGNYLSNRDAMIKVYDISKHNLTSELKVLNYHYSDALITEDSITFPCTRKQIFWETNELTTLKTNRNCGDLLSLDRQGNYDILIYDKGIEC